MAKPIGTLGVIPTLTVGGWTFTDLTTLIILHAASSNSGDFYTLRKSNASAGYQVTAGKTYTINAVEIAMATVGSSIYYFGYGDTDVGFVSASPPTNAFYLANDSTLGGQLLPMALPVGQILGIPMIFPIPALKYVFMSPAASAIVGSITTFGYEA